jgi:G:T-mismatch repair DNA endonuclease (very short patch repair protein)
MGNWLERKPTCFSGWVVHPEQKGYEYGIPYGFCTPYSQTEESKIKRVQSRSWYRPSKETIEKIKKSNSGRKLTEEHKAKLRKTRIRKGIPHSEETKRKLSQITKSQWKNGIHKPKFKSKGQLEMIEILQKFGFYVKDEHNVGGRPFDAFVKSKNLLIEFNGTFWHRDPRVEKYKIDPMSQSIWNHDKEKIDNARKLGYDVKVIWQMDWESCKDKESYIRELLC